MAKSKIQLITPIEKWCLSAAFSIIFLVKFFDGPNARRPSGPRRPSAEGPLLGSVAHLPDPEQTVFTSQKRPYEALSEGLSASGFALSERLSKHVDLNDEQRIFIQKAANRLAKQFGDGEKAPNLAPVVRDLLITFERTELIFKRNQPKKGDQHGHSLIQTALSDERTAENVFAAIELNFRIPREDARAFAKGHDWASLADWADFVERRQR